MKAKPKAASGNKKAKTKSDKFEKHEERFHSAFENMLEGVQMLGHDWRYLYLNHTAEVHNRRPNQELLDNKYMDMWPGIEATHVFSVIKSCLEERVPARLENRFVYPDGKVGWFNLSIQPIPEGILILSFDITERVRAETQSRQMKRLYAALSQVNQAIVRVRSRPELFESICRVAVDFGEFPLAWIGLLDHETGVLKPVAVHGYGQNKLPFESINPKEKPFKEGLIGLSIQSGLAQFSGDIQVDAHMAYWREAAIKADYHSAAAIPIQQNGQIIGLLNLYAIDIDFFLADEEQSLLKEMGMDISFALDTMESEKLMHQWADAFEHCGHGIAIGLPSGKLMTCNPAFAREHGATVPEIASMPILDMYAPQDHEQIRQFIAMADREGNVRFEATKIRRDGSIYPVEMDLVSVRDENGNLLYRVATQQNITERKQAEEKLILSEIRYRRLFESAKDGILILDAESGLIVDVNPFLTSLLGYSKEAFLGKHIWELGFFRDIVANKANFRELQEKEYIRYDDLPLKTASGRMIDVEFVSNAYQAEHKKVIQCNIRDITERKRAREELLASEMRFRHAVINAPIPMLIHDEDDNNLTLSAGWTKYSGYTLEDIPTMGDWTRLAYGEHSNSAKEYIDKLFEINQTVNNGEWIINTQTGEKRTWVFFTTPIGKSSNGKRILLSLAIDITERKQAEEMLEKKNVELKTMSQQLWQAAKLATMGELAASIAHELNNPLATVSLRTEMLQAQFAPEDLQSRSLQIIDSEIKRMSGLVANLLQFSRRSASQISTIDVNEEIIKALDLIQYHFRKNSIITVQELSPGTQLIQADRQQLRQVFLNLFTNAADAMPLGGMLTIRTWSGEKQEAGITAPLKRQVTASLGLPVSDVPKVFIEVSDTGEGIPLERLEKVWEPFYTTKPEGKGTGLGLAICRRIIQEHGGTMELNSEGIPGKGTTVGISLPAPAER